MDFRSFLLKLDLNPIKILYTVLIIMWNALDRTLRSQKSQKLEGTFAWKRWEKAHSLYDLKTMESVAATEMH